MKQNIRKKMERKNNNKFVLKNELTKKGFTLIEMISTIVIIVIISLITTPIILNIIEKVKISTFKRDVETALNSFIMQKQIKIIEEGAVVENMLVTDESLNLEYNKFISGGIYTEGNEIYMAVQVTDGNYCGNGELGKITVTKGTCEAELNKFTVETELEWNNKEKEVKINNGSGIPNIMYYLSESEEKPIFEDENWQSSNVFLKNKGIYYAFIKDEYGGISEGKEIKVDKIDMIKPILEVEIENMTTHFDTKIIASDEGGSGLSYTNKYEYYISTSDTAQTGGSWQNYTSGTSFNIDYVDNDKRYLWVYPIQDNAGNYNDENTNNTTPVCIGVLDFSSFDTVKPVLTLTSINTTPTSATLKITVADVGLGLDPTNKYQYYLSTSNTTQTGGSWQNYTNETNFTVSGTSGTYYLWVYPIQDKAGNYNGSHTSITPYVIATYIFDSDKPTLTVVSTYTSTTAATVRLTATDIGTGLATTNKYQYYLSTSSTTQTGGNWTTYTSGTTFSVTLKTGANYLWVYPIQDKAGNYNGNHTSVTPYVIDILTIYTLTVNANGGTWSGTTPQIVPQGNTVTIANPTRGNYIFNGWTVSGAGSSINGTTFKMGTANTTLTANWVSCFTTGKYTYTGTSERIDDGNGNYRLKFKTSGTFTSQCALSIDVFLVGGGGGSVAGGSGGGGGGYATTSKNITLTANTGYAVTIGTGGVANPTSGGGQVGGRGGTSSAFGKSAAGGYGGIFGSGGGNGGSGGGGYTMGNGGSSCGNGGAGGSTGGTGQGGTNACREFGEAGTTLYAGGGGAAGSNMACGSYAGTGGAGGGGHGGGLGVGCSGATAIAPTPGTTNTGGGAGGGYIYGVGAANGGSGIVVIRNAR